HRARVRDLAFAPASNLLASADADGRVRVFTVPEGRLCCECRHGKAVNSVCFDGSGGRLLTASRDQTARLWSIDAAAHKATESLPLLGHGGEVARASFDPGWQRVVTACQDNVVRVF